MKMIKVGIIGIGKMGLLHFGILNSFNDVRVSSIADKEKMVRNFTSNLLKNVEIYDDFEKLLDNVDVIYVTTPVSSHVQITEKCLENNIHCFLEKPFSRNLEECKKTVELLKKSKSITAVGYYLRFSPTFSKVKEVLQEGILGEITYVNSSIYMSQLFKKSKGWRFQKEISGGGVLLDLGVHLIDLLIWYFGKVETVTGKIKSHFSEEVEDFAHAILNFKNNLVVNMDSSWSVKNYRLQETTIEIHGEKGVLKVNDDYIKISLTESAGKYKQGDTIIYRQSIPNGVSIDVGGPDYTKEDRYFIDCIKQNRQPMTDLKSAINVQSVVDAVYKSSETESWQEVKYIV